VNSNTFLQENFDFNALEKNQIATSISTILARSVDSNFVFWNRFKATDTRAIFFWRWQCNGGKIVALPSRERNCLCIMLCDGNEKLRAIVAEISNHLIFGNDCRKLGGVV
jgi:hypothetical protein